ncbi:hypothetical protein ACOSQ3_016763 [Xanthoceras sorbifolium]
MFVCFFFFSRRDPALSPLSTPSSSLIAAIADLHYLLTSLSTPSSSLIAAVADLCAARVRDPAYVSSLSAHLSLNTFSSDPALRAVAITDLRGACICDQA